MQITFLGLGGVLCALAIAGGAFGAHGLAERLAARELALWETAARYLFYGGLGLALVGLAAGQLPRESFTASGWCLLAGSLVFSATVALLALGGPRSLGAVTPIGGVLMILGFALFAWTALRATVGAG